MQKQRPPHHQRHLGLIARLRELVQQVYALWQRPRLAYVPERNSHTDKTESRHDRLTFVARQNASADLRNDDLWLAQSPGREMHDLEVKDN